MFKNLNTQGVIVMGFLGVVLIVGLIFFSLNCRSVSQIIAGKDYSSVSDKDLKALLMCGQVFRGQKGAEGSTAVCGKLADHWTEEKREKRKKSRYTFCKEIEGEAVKAGESLKEALRINIDCWKSMNEK